MPMSATFVYKQQEEIKAFISILNDSFIGALFVSQEHQGQGIGRQLLDYCQTRYPSLELDVYAENKSAVDFYKRCGFVIKGEQRNESSGQLEYAMAWTAI
ncbi:GNAT family N-acetyltransferase [Paenibacillus albidus]|uniref:GNAT family N-acetyltransferase n=1 Tax=Paenibacillus albidus TaxID=2041023 RepID=UPI001BE58C1B|nr:GNAT family N-acetyltransferase [Paenibacillus albidus]